jgi:predicted PurR-regulated permease PerM
MRPVHGKWQRIEQIAGIAFLVLIGIGCFVVLRPFVTAVLWAAILCYATWPLYRRIEQFVRGRKNLAAALMTGLIALVLVLPFAIVGMTFADNVTRLAQRIHTYGSQGVPPPPEWAESIPYVGDYWQNLYENRELAVQTLKKWYDKVSPTLLRWSISLGHGILQLTLSMFIAFFFYRDGVALVARLDEGIKRIAGGYSQRLMETVGTTVKSVVYGLLGTAVAQGIMAGIGFSIAGIPAAFLWALLTFLLSLVPGGPPLVWAPATIWLFSRGETGWGIFMGLWGLVAISGIDNLVRPLLISRRTTLPFILTLLGVMGGVIAFGFIGIFIGPTLLAAGYSLVQEFLRQKPAQGAPEAEGTQI